MGAVVGRPFAGPARPSPRWGYRRSAQVRDRPVRAVPGCRGVLRGAHQTLAMAFTGQVRGKQAGPGGFTLCAPCPRRGEPCWWSRCPRGDGRRDVHDPGAPDRPRRHAVRGGWPVSLHVAGCARSRRGSDGSRTRSGVSAGAAGAGLLVALVLASADYDRAVRARRTRLLAAAGPRPPWPPTMVTESVTAHDQPASAPRTSSDEPLRRGRRAFAGPVLAAVGFSGLGVAAVLLVALTTASRCGAGERVPLDPTDGDDAGAAGRWSVDREGGVLGRGDRAATTVHRPGRSVRRAARRRSLSAPGTQHGERARVAPRARRRWPALRAVKPPTIRMGSPSAIEATVRVPAESKATRTSTPTEDTTVSQSSQGCNGER
ncbi:hypothetical protein QJS66_12085 [Kocuria rhizophila]|nr:hypothetical protein QJS66_12085 [Kocuria rhizophila]